jgi:hypothetical protein
MDMVVTYVSFKDRLVILADGRQLRIVQFVDSQGNSLPKPYDDPPLDDPGAVQLAAQMASKLGGGFICGSPEPTELNPSGSWFLVPMKGLEPIIFH